MLKVAFLLRFERNGTTLTVAGKQHALCKKGRQKEDTAVENRTQSLGTVSSTIQWLNTKCILATQPNL